MRSQNAVNERLLLSVGEVAQILGIGRNLTYELVRQNKIPHIRLGRRVLIPRMLLHDWLVMSTKESPKSATRDTLLVQIHG
jgi:excisionase family DNA binding protein